MTPKYLPLPSVGNITPGQPVTVDLTIGPRYKTLMIEATVKNTTQAPAISDILDLINLKVNGKVQRAHKAVELDALNTLDGETNRVSKFGCTGALYGVLVAPTVSAGTSSGFAVGDILQAAGGTGVPATFQVLTVSTGALATVRVLNPGAYSVLPTAANAVTVLRGSGTVGTATLALLFNPLSTLAPNFALASAGGYGIEQTGDTVTYHIPILLAEPNRKEYDAADFFSLPTRWPNGEKLDSVQLEIFIPNNPGCTLHAVAVYVERDDMLGVYDANGKPVLGIVKYRRTTEPYTGTGELGITRLPRNGAYQQISIFNPAGDTISSCKVKVNGSDIRDVTKNRNDVLLCKREMNELAISPDRFDMVFDVSDKPTDWLIMDGASEFQILPVIAVAAASSKNLVLICKVYGGLD